ncbi:ATP-binding protein [Aquabacterium sp.]|uniref:ATP-binding protein n=1 Tax=Aquabacterium sp. TaxID=1872578 RepID=UPI002B96B44C|nr:ATP-binding protein [Aquabacterium sp.]HSW05826.1 ATP-binding protein [Aquabacterium sp.]
MNPDTPDLRRLLQQREEELAQRVLQLETSEALKTAIVDHALAALVSTDATGLIVEFNPAAETMFGHRRGDVLGRAVAEVMIPERFRAAHVAGMRRLQAGAAPRVMGKRLELQALHADGSEFPMEMVLWRTDAGGQVFYTASVADLSERHRAAAQIEQHREALRQSEKLSAMGGLLAGVAHELNNPLAIVMGRAGLLEEKCAELPAITADARFICEAADRCGRIVRTFLDMARRRPPQRGPIAINTLVRTTIEMLQYGLRTHRIELLLELGEALPAVLADGDQIGQIIVNLLVNAQQALAGSSGARQVRVQTGVETRRDDREQRVWLRVADNGPGIPPALRPRIFDAFFTTKPEGTGTGLGLSLSRSLARSHGGELTLEAASPGASFRLSLPIGGEAGLAVAPVHLALSSAAAQGRVLVIDDETALANMMRDMLAGAGHDVRTADGAAAALTLLGAETFDLVIFDLRMPDMDGAELWRRIQALRPALARRMLIATGDTLSADAQAFLRNAECPSLEKPFSKADLLAAVARCLQR